MTAAAASIGLIQPVLAQACFDPPHRVQNPATTYQTWATENRCPYKIEIEVVAGFKRSKTPHEVTLDACHGRYSWQVTHFEYRGMQPQSGNNEQMCAPIPDHDGNVISQLTDKLLGPDTDQIARHSALLDKLNARLKRVNDAAQDFDDRANTIRSHVRQQEQTALNSRAADMQTEEQTEEQSMQHLQEQVNANTATIAQQTISCKHITYDRGALPACWVPLPQSQGAVSSNYCEDLGLVIGGTHYQTCHLYEDTFGSGR